MLGSPRLLIFAAFLLLTAAPDARATEGAGSDTVCILLGGHGYGLTGDSPSEALLAGIDTLGTFGAQAFISGGDAVNHGTPAQWDFLAALIAPWGIPHYAVVGNHEANNIAEYTARFGSPYRSHNVGSTRILILNTAETPNSKFSEPQEIWFSDALQAAATDTTVKRVLIAMHHLLWVKAHPRYEIFPLLGNAGWSDFTLKGYDVNPFFDDLWPEVVALAAQKPIVCFAGDIGWNNALPSLFYDELDGVTLIACGTSPDEFPPSDAYILYYAEGDTTRFQAISPWGTNLGSVEDYGVEYWNNHFLARRNCADLDSVYVGPENEDAIALPGGTFEMGTHFDELSLDYSATTGRSVTVSPFTLSTREVTVGEYAAFLQDRGNNDCGLAECVDLDDSHCPIEFVGGVYQAKDSGETDHPMVEVTWLGAAAFCDAKSQVDGLEPVYNGGLSVDLAKTGWRLPTDAEFEFAIRGGEGYTDGKTKYFRFPWMDDDYCQARDYANYYGTGGADVWEGTAPVGSFPPNQYGFYDLSGNVFEWIQDPWAELAPGNFNDPILAGTLPGWRMIRGGGFNYSWTACRNAYRSAEEYADSQSYIGFRVAKTGGVVPAHVVTFGGRRGAGKIVVEWSAEGEASQSAGFYLYRETAASPRDKVTERFFTGAGKFTFVDEDPPGTDTDYWLAELGRTGSTTWHGPLTVRAGSALTLALAQNMPNPFSSSTVLDFELPRSGAVSLVVYDLRGARVATLMDEVAGPGLYTITWDGTGRTGRLLPAGLYFYRLVTPDGVLTRKLLLDR